MSLKDARYHVVMKGALGMLLLLITTTVSQPLLAIPAPCQSGMAEWKTKPCAACCAEMPCCAPSKQLDSSRVNAVGNPNADTLTPLLVAQIAISAPLPPLSKDVAHGADLRQEHAPPPRALNCIQLI